MIGTVIHEQYQIQELVGEGGMGIVYKAFDLELERPVALKFLKVELSDNEQLIRRFRDELKVLAGFNHPNITTLYTSFTQNGCPVMVMELLEGETLGKMVYRRGPIPANVSVSLIVQALAGVGEAHRRGIIHRDLKPANLMLNQAGVIKVMDFGIARIESSPGLTRTTAAMGTPYYMSPEQVDPRRFGLTHVDSRTDIYSMGISLYEMLAGEVPFQGPTEFTIQLAHLEKSPQPPTVFYPHIPSGVVDAVLRAMSKDPRNRFQTAEEFAQTLVSGLNTAPAQSSAADAATPALAGGDSIRERRPSGEVQHIPATAAQIAPIFGSQSSGAPSPASTGNVMLTGEANAAVSTQGVRAGFSPSRMALVGVLGLLVLVIGGLGLYAVFGRPPQVPIEASASRGGSGGGANGVSTGIGSEPASPGPKAPSESDTPEPNSTEANNVVIDLPGTTPTRKTTEAKPIVNPGSQMIASPQRVVAGRWSGSYMRCEENTPSLASLSLVESAGSDPGVLNISGTLAVSTSKGAQNCRVNGTFMRSRNRLVFQTACSSFAPDYLSLTHNSVVSLNQDQLSGMVYPDPPCVVVSFKRR